MKVEIFGSKKGLQQIETLEDWRRFAPPASDIHWKEGRSACELARAWVKNGPAVPNEVLSLFSSSDVLSKLQFLRAHAEYLTKFEDTPNGPRNHDLLVEAALGEQRVLIGIEGKEREEFDKSLSVRFAAKQDQAGSKFPARVNEFCLGMFGEPYSPRYAELKYQFLSASAGILAEKEKGSDLAVLLIHQFVSADTPSKDIERNKQDYAFFIKLMKPELETVQENVLYGPFQVPGCSLFPSRPLFIGKITTNLD